MSDRGGMDESNAGGPSRSRSRSGSRTRALAGLEDSQPSTNPAAHLTPPGLGPLATSSCPRPPTRVVPGPYGQSMNRRPASAGPAGRPSDYGGPAGRPVGYVDARQVHMSNTYNQNTTGMTDQQKEEIRNAISHLGSEAAAQLELLFQNQRQHQANQNELAEAIETVEKRRIEQHKQLLLESQRQNEELTKQWEEGQNHTTEQVKAMYEQSTTTLRLEMQYELEKIRKESLAQAVRAQTPAASLHPTFAAYRPPEITRPKEEVVKERREREEMYERNLATILAAQPVVSAKALYNPPILNQYETFREWKAATSE